MSSSMRQDDAEQKPAGTRDIARRLLAWYDRHRRDLPWRAPTGTRPDPYHVWLSEIMLQQTTVAAVAPYFRAFLARWPTIRDLAEAEREAVMAAWAGLGYYARARNLHRCARMLHDEHGGRFPMTERELKQLPGIGDYTAAAIAAIAFDRPAVAVDGNIERVVARLFAIEAPLPGAKKAIKQAAAALVPEDRPGDYTQAMMDLGATVCLAGTPRCSLCPLMTDCEAHALGIAETLPLKAPKRDRPTRRGIAFWVIDGAGRVLLRRRPDDGLLGGMTEIPSTEWAAERPDSAEAERQAPLAADWQALPGMVRHTFTHFHLELEVWAARSTEEEAPEGSFWRALDTLGAEALPSVMAKVARHALTRGDGAD